MGNYWSATDDYQREHGGNPTCPIHGTEMFPQDDHGRFVCFECGIGNPLDVVTGTRLRTPRLPQIIQDMPDPEKAKIPPIFRLGLTPTAAEARLLACREMNAEYFAAEKAVDEERKAASKE